MSTIDESLSRARHLLKTIRHAAMATVNEDGTPHNTPFFFLHDKNLSHIYWGSHPDSLHSKNIERTGQIFVVVYDAVKPQQGGVYIKAENAHALSGEELKIAVDVHNEFRAREGKDSLKTEYYEGDSPQRMYSAETSHCWILMNEKDSGGRRIRDYRQEVNISELVS